MPPGHLGGAGPRGAAPADASQGLTLRMCASAVLRRWKFVLGFTVLGVLAGLGGMRLLTLEYMAQVTIWVEGSGQRNAGQGPIQQGELLESYGWVDLARSFSVLDLVARGERLYLRVLSEGDADRMAAFGVAEEFTPGVYELSVQGGAYKLARQGKGTVETGRIGDPIGRSLGFRWQPSAASIPSDHAMRFELVPVRDASAQLGEAIEPVMSADGRFLRLQLRGTEPERIASVLNTLGAQFVEVAAELKRAKLDQLANILREQLDFAAAGLQAEEAALEAFRVQTITLPSDRGMPVNPGLESTRAPAFDNFFRLSIEREQIQRERSDLARTLSADRTGSEALDALRLSTLVQRSPALAAGLDQEQTKRAEIAALQTQYTREHQAVRRAENDLQALRARLLKLASSLDDDLREREESLEALIASASATLRGIPPRAVEEARLQRRVEIAEDLYRNLQQRHEEARLASVSSIPDLRLQDRAAVPYYPVNDRRILILFGAIVASIGIAVLVAIVLERMDTRLREPEQVSEGMGLPILGALPVLPRSGRHYREEQMRCVEAFRNTRINLVHAFGTAPPLTVTITSPGSGDGKSFSCVNLAMSFAEIGQPTLLIDGDTRRGTLHRVLNAGREPGLVDYLGGSAALGDIVQVVGDGPRFHFISCGTPLLGAPKLLESGAMSRLLVELRSRYRVIIVDSPPLGAAVDALVLGMHTGNMAVVLRNGVSDRALATSKLAALDRLPIRLLGAILNGVPKGGSYRNYAYLPGYEPVGAAPELVGEEVAT